MILRVLESLILLVRFDVMMRVRPFKSLHSVVRETPVETPNFDELRTVKELCHAVDLASVFYFKPVLCLQRSAATTLLLRRYGWAAEMVIGAQVLPFKSHAWVEVSGDVVNDKPYVAEIYRVLERC